MRARLVDLGRRLHLRLLGQRLRPWVTLWLALMVAVFLVAQLAPAPSGAPPSPFDLAADSLRLGYRIVTWPADRLAGLTDNLTKGAS